MHVCVSHSIQANSGNLNTFIHLPTREFLEGRIRKAHDNDEGPSSNQDQVAIETQETPAAPPQFTVEVDPQLVQAGEGCIVACSFDCNLGKI